MITPPNCWGWRPATRSRSEAAVTLLRLQGPDSLRFLHGQSSQAIATAPAGSCLATCLISATARMRALALVLVDHGGAWLVIEAGDGEAVRAGLDRVLFPADQVVLGPLQQGLLIEAVPPADPAAGDASDPASDTGRDTGSWQALGDGVGEGEPAAWLLGDGRVLLSAGSTALPAALACCPELSTEEQQRWRIQQGWPSAPGELNDDTNPFELGLAPRVSLNKGCYVGQETLAKLATYDGVKQQLRRWCWTPQHGEPAEPVPAPAEQLFSPGGERAGLITSALPLEAGRLWIGLALVRRSALELPQLQTAAGCTVSLSCPDGFVAPPAAAQRPTT